jgi:general secretion pathway protein L
MNRNIIRNLWEWWSGQIRELVPTVDLRVLANRQSMTEVLLSRSGARLFRRQRLKKPLTQEGDEIAGFEGKITAANFSMARDSVILTLDESLCFVRETAVPVPAVRRAGEILALELSRLSPISKDDILSFWFPNRKNEPGKIGFTHVVARRSAISPAILALQKDKIRILAIAFRNQGESAAPLVLDASGSTFASVRERNWKRTAVLAASVLALLCSACVWQLISRLDNDQTRAEQSLLAAQASAKTVRLALDIQQGHAETLAELKKLRGNRSRLLDYWEELSRILPDSAWLQSLSLKENIMTLEGAAVDAESLIRTLEDSGAFRNVKFVSPVLKNPGEDKARFTISAEPEVQTR